METNLEVKRVPFLGTELMAARDENGEIWAGVKAMCNGIGLSSDQGRAQVKTVQSDFVLKEGCVKFDTGVFDPNNIAIALKLDFVPLWLAKIAITPAMKEDSPELAETLKQYQLRAKDVLAAAFLPKEYQPKSAMDMLRAQYQALFELDGRVDKMGGRVDKLEDKLNNQMTIDHGQQYQLQKAVKARAYARMAESIPAREIPERRASFFSSLYHDLKTRFGVPSYRDIRPVDYPAATAYVENWIEPAELRRCR